MKPQSVWFDSTFDENESFHSYSARYWRRCAREALFIAALFTVISLTVTAASLYVALTETFFGLCILGLLPWSLWCLIDVLRHRRHWSALASNHEREAQS